ncbi:hypothetical protein EYF80_012289 [Liparis tanakae]|uniref:Uncharacterized protein n=1 Tax=Liparis tanakae TaxID=230148 RepID=A0A4Z2IIE5_9TELE|nr:hypothetical protein EYF80_012289 [Liparis tanakae]
MTGGGGGGGGGGQRRNKIPSRGRWSSSCPRGKAVLGKKLNPKLLLMSGEHPAWLPIPGPAVTKLGGPGPGVRMAASSRPALLLAVSLAEKDALSAPLDCGHLLTEPASHVVVSALVIATLLHPRLLQSALQQRFFYTTTRAEQYGRDFQQHALGVGSQRAGRRWRPFESELKEFLNEGGGSVFLFREQYGPAELRSIIRSKILDEEDIVVLVTAKNKSSRPGLSVSYPVKVMSHIVVRACLTPLRGHLMELPLTEQQELIGLMCLSSL